MNSNRSCPQCGEPISAEAPQGLCPRCVLGTAAALTETIEPGNSGEAASLEDLRAAFPQVEILELLGQGGMGWVYKARQPHLDRFVALKILFPRLSGDPAFTERFNREARVLARLNHPNIVAVYDFGRAGHFYFLLMEYVDGVNLRQAMRSGRFSPAEALALVPRICDALQFAHDEGVLHRDIKPENILLDTRGRVKIADFGIAKLVGKEDKQVTLTATGLAVGTPQYMAPEQLENPQSIDQRADIYSLGVVFYEMLTGELPIGRFPPPSETTGVDPRIDEVVFQALERERDKRFRRADEVKTRVDAIRADPAAPPSGRREGSQETSSRIGLVFRLAAWTVLLLAIFAVLVPWLWLHWWPTIYGEQYSVGLQPESGAYPSVELRSDRKLYCWGQNENRRFAKTDWIGKAVLTLPGNEGQATLEFDSKTEQWRWNAPNGRVWFTREEEPRAEQVGVWLSAAGIDTTNPEVLAEAVSLVRLVRDAAKAEVPGRAGPRTRPAIEGNRVGPFRETGGNGWGYTWIGAAVVDHRIASGAAFIVVWLAGVARLVQRSRPGQGPGRTRTYRLFTCLALAIVSLWFVAEFGPPSVTMLNGPDLALLELGRAWHLGTTVGSVFAKVLAMTALLAVANFFAWRSWWREQRGRATAPATAPQAPSANHPGSK